jgi:hypothetical protein
MRTELTRRRLPTTPSPEDICHKMHTALAYRMMVPENVQELPPWKLRAVDGSVWLLLVTSV